MANILFSWINRGDSATLTGGSWLSTLPLANVQNRQVQRVARSTNAAIGSTVIYPDLLMARGIGVVALVGHNLSATARVRVMANDAFTFAAPLYFSEWMPVWPDGGVLQDLLEWEDDTFWLANFSQELLTGYRAPFVFVLPVPQVFRYWKIEIDDEDNPDGFVQIGRLFMGPSWQPAFNYQYSAELVYEDPTPIETSLSGAEYFDERPRARIFRCTLGGLSNGEAYAGVLEMQRAAGTSGEVLLVPDVDDTTYSPMRSFLGRMRRLLPVAQANPVYQTATIEIKESI